MKQKAAIIYSSSWATKMFCKEAFGHETQQATPGNKVRVMCLLDEATEPRKLHTPLGQVSMGRPRACFKSEILCDYNTPAEG